MCRCVRSVSGSFKYPPQRTRCVANVHTKRGDSLDAVSLASEDIHIHQSQSPGYTRTTVTCFVVNQCFTPGSMSHKYSANDFETVPLSRIIFYTRPGSMSCKYSANDFETVPLSRIIFYTRKKIVYEQGKGTVVDYNTCTAHVSTFLIAG